MTITFTQFVFVALVFVHIGVCIGLALAELLDDWGRPQCCREYRPWDSNDTVYCALPRWHFGHHRTSSGMVFRRDLGKRPSGN